MNLSPTSTLSRVAVIPALVLAGALSACSNFGVYRLDVQQGNLVTQEQVSKVRPGMTRLDVRNLLGTPLLQDAFSDKRWDYIYTEDRNTDKKLNPFGRIQQQFKVTVIFDGEKVARVEGVASPVEILTGGGERRRTPDATPPNAPPEPRK
ncbi:MAG: outer membrane protein assembly factor BamE [Burkholderiales bacterium]|nr:outer membrane protein assembly factor BamE [Rhodocyclaceae bacterium]